MRKIKRVRVFMPPEPDTSETKECIDTSSSNKPGIVTCTPKRVRKLCLDTSPSINRGTPVPDIPGANRYNVIPPKSAYTAVPLPNRRLTYSTLPVSQPFKGNMPHELDLKSLVSMYEDPDNWYATLKLNGLRVVLEIQNDGTVLAHSREGKQVLMSSVVKLQAWAGTVLDTEAMHPDTLVNENTWKTASSTAITLPPPIRQQPASLKRLLPCIFFVFDCLIYSKQSLYDESFAYRLQQSRVHLPQLLSVLQSVNLMVCMKRFEPIQQAGQLLLPENSVRYASTAGAERRYRAQSLIEPGTATHITTLANQLLPADGLIFMRGNSQYYGNQPFCLKWKLKQTVDLSVSYAYSNKTRVPDQFVGSYATEQGATTASYARLRVVVPYNTPWLLQEIHTALQESQHGSNVIVECYYVGHAHSADNTLDPLRSSAWHAVGVRRDKTRANFSSVVVHTMMRQIDNITCAMLSVFLNTAIDMD